MATLYGVSTSWIDSSLANSRNGLITSDLLYAMDVSRFLCYNYKTGINDLAGSTVTGTLTNGPVYNADNFGSIFFDGSNDYIALNDGADTYDPILLPQACTVYAWVKTSSNKTNPILDDRTGGPANVGLRIDSSGKLQYLQYDGQWNSYTSSGTSVSIGVWSHIAFTRANSVLGPVKMYLNSVLNHTVTVSSPRILAGGNMTHIGVSWNGGSFHGNIAMVLVYSAEHSQSQINQMYAVHRKRFGV